jgi:hypothetical protein
VNGSTVEDVEGSDRDGDDGTNEGDPRDIGVHDLLPLASAESSGVEGVESSDVEGVELSGVEGVESSGVEVAELFDVVGTAGKDVDGVRAILARMECSF